MQIFGLHHELFHEREWSWLIFLLNKNSRMWVIVAHFFWEVIVSDLAHEKSELAQLWTLEQPAPEMARLIVQ